MDVDRAALMRLFLSDSEEELARFEAEVLVLEEHPEDAATVDGLFRLAHTLKGNAAVLALDHMSKWAHTLEDLLDAVRARRAAVTTNLISLLLRSVDALRSMLASLRAGEPDNPMRYGGLQDELVACIATANNDAPRAESGAVRPVAAEGAAPAAEGRWGPALRIEMTKIDH